MTISEGSLLAPRKQITKASGNYSLREIPVGRYLVSFELNGFKTVIFREVAIEASRNVTLDVAMATIPMTDTKELLERVFTDHWSALAPITPTVMLAREETYRPLFL